MDLQLVNLLRRVAQGYSASSVDLETFFGLNYACERLGSSNPDSPEVIVKDLATSSVFRVQEKEELGAPVVSVQRAD